MRTLGQLVDSLRNVANGTDHITTQQYADIREAANLLEQVAQMAANANRAKSQDFWIV